MSGGGAVVICRGGPWAHQGPQLVRLIRIVSSSEVSDTETYLVEHVLTGERHKVQDYNVYMGKTFNEMEVLAWAASQGDRE